MSEQQQPHPETPMSLYNTIYWTLMALLVVTVAVAYLHVGRWALPIALTIAAVKAALVVTYFMHMRYSARLIWIYLAVSLVWLSTLIVGVAADVLTR